MATTAVSTFRALHASGCFVIANPWDVGSAVILHRLGFKALASTSAGFAFTLGRPDRINATSVDDTLAHLRALVAATPSRVQPNANAVNASVDDTRNPRRETRLSAAGLDVAGMVFMA